MQPFKEGVLRLFAHYSLTHSYRWKVPTALSFIISYDFFSTYPQAYLLLTESCHSMMNKTEKQFSQHFHFFKAFPSLSKAFPRLFQSFFKAFKASLRLLKAFSWLSRRVKHNNFYGKMRETTSYFTMLKPR